MRVITRADANGLGLKRYFTGSPCRHGHVAERRASDHGCVECSRLKAASPKERERRREYMAEHQRQYRKMRPDLVRSTESKRDKSERAATRRDDRKKNPERCRSVLRKSFQKHKAKRMAESREWIRLNPDAHSRLQRAAKSKRRALERSAEGSYTRQDIERMYAAQNFICAACPADISERYHVDHMLPLARGGTNRPDNLQLLCPTCNRSKGAKTMTEWISWKTMLRHRPLNPAPQGR